MLRKHSSGKKIRIVVTGALAISMYVTSGFTQSTVTIDVKNAKNIVPKTMFGTLMERLGRQWSNTGAFVGTSSSIPNSNGMRKDVIEAFKECGVGAIQWPGGCAAWSYKWVPSSPSNDVGTDRFLEFCKLTGAEPVICGPHYQESAASNTAWIKHIDSTTAKLGMDSLKWFKIGNEVWGGCGTGMDVNTYCTNYEVNYTRMKAVRPSLKFESCSQNEDRGFASVSGWFKSIVSTLGTKTDGIEYHDYIFRTTWNSSNFTTAQYWQIMYDGTVGDFAGHMRTNVIPVMDAADPEKRIKIIVDEWGDWLLGDNWLQTGTIMNGLSAANQLHLMMSNADRIEVACLAQGINVIHSLLNINTSSVMVKTPTFYVFKMFKPHHSNGAKWAPITASNIETTKQSTAVSGSVTMPLLTVGSTVDANGHVNISVNNNDLTIDRKITFTISSDKAEYVIDSAQIVSGSAMNSENPFGGAETVFIKDFPASNYTLSNSGKTLAATIPARSIVMFRLKLPGVKNINEKIYNSRLLSIYNNSNRIEVTNINVNKKTTFSIHLYGIDGKLIVDKYNGTIEAGNQNIVWKPQKSSLGKNTYIVKVKIGNVIQSKQVMLD
jgi:alpha-N-arabinofuranosidase